MKKDKIKNKIFLLTVTVLLFGTVGFCLAHLPRIIYSQTGDIKIIEPENSQAFYDELKGVPRNYFVNSNSEFTLYVNLLVPDPENHYGRYSVNIYSVKSNPSAQTGKEEKLFFIDGQISFEWQEFYEEFGRDYYLKGPELEKVLPAGDYKIEIFSYENKGKYVLAVGKKEVFPVWDSVKVYWILPMLKIQFFKTSVLEFIFTPFGIVGVGIIGAVLLLFIFLSVVFSAVKKLLSRKPKMLLLTSSGIRDSKEDILAILPKPVENTRLAYVITASKPEEYKDYVDQDRELLKEAGFNVEDFDIEGKNSIQLLKQLSVFDVIYVEGGNTFYLLDKMRRCDFRAVMKKLFRDGIIYVGASAGSIVAGKNIYTAKLLGDKNAVGIRTLKGLGFMPFNIFVHYTPDSAGMIKKRNWFAKRKLKILQDGQAMFIFGRKITFVGTGTVVNPRKL